MIYLFNLGIFPEMGLQTQFSSIFSMGFSSRKHPPAMVRGTPWPWKPPFWVILEDSVKKFPDGIPRVLSFLKPSTLSEKHHRSHPFFFQQQNWLVVWNILYFPICWVANHPNGRTPSFFRGVAKNHQPVFCSTTKSFSPQQKNHHEKTSRNLSHRWRKKTSAERWEVHRQKKGATVGDWKRAMSHEQNSCFCIGIWGL